MRLDPQLQVDAVVGDVEVDHPVACQVDHARLGEPMGAPTHICSAIVARGGGSGLAEFPHTVVKVANQRRQSPTARSRNWRAAT